MSNVSSDQDGRVDVILDNHILAYLGRHMRDLYGPTDPVSAPQIFTALLARLERALAAQGEALSSEVRNGMLAAMPSLRAFARSLLRDYTRADDLVQETLMKAWKHRQSFQSGTNLEAWLFIIMRNTFYTEGRKKKWEVQDIDGTVAEHLSTAPSQGDRLDLQDMLVALQQLPEVQREALVLIVLNGISYEEAAVVMQCKLGTVKSRVCRGRERLAQILGYSSVDLGSDRITRSVVG